MSNYKKAEVMINPNDHLKQKKCVMKMSQVDLSFPGL